MSESADITFQDTLNQWKLAPSKFAANYYKTKIEIGETYVREFKKSFDLKNPRDRKILEKPETRLSASDIE